MRKNQNVNSVENML